MKRKDGLLFIIIKRTLFLLFFMQGPAAFAQPSVLEFKNFDPLADITSSKSSIIIEDSVGYLWIGTEEGLFRFDGQTVHHYFQDNNNPGSLPSNGINNLVLDADNNLWIGTKTGLCKYNREFNDFSTIEDKSEMNGFKKCFIKVFTFDKNGQLFVAYNQVVYAYNHSEGQFDKAIKVDSGDISCLVFDDQNNLWIGATTNGGLYRFDLKNKELTHFLHDPFNDRSISINEISTLAVSGQTLWIGTLGKGIDTYDLTNKTFKHYFFSKNLENYINSIFISKDQKAWVCTLFNFKLFNPQSGEFHDYENDIDNPYSVGRSLQGVYEDHSGNLWNIHSYGGIRLAKKDKLFKQKRGNSGNLITAMEHDGKGQLWVSNHAMGIDIYNPKTLTTTRLKHQKDNPRSVSDGVIFSIFRDSKDQMWVGSYLGGLQKYNPETNDFDTFKHDPEDSLSIACNDIRSITEDAEGNLWLATHRIGVDRFDVKEQKFYHYNAKNSLLCDRYTNQVFVDSRDNLWVATVWGLGFLPKGEQKFINFFNHLNDKHSISNNEIQVIHEDRLKNIWIGTNDGLSKFNYETRTFSHYASGLKNKHIAGILSDDKNNLWVSTSTGISRFDPIKLRFTNYNQNYGIESKEFYDRSCTMDSEGTMFFGGSNGYEFFTPDHIIPETRTPKVMLTDFKLFNKSISCRIDSHIIDRHISYANRISLDYFQNSITFLYQTISLTDAINIEYAYQLEGFDKDWVSAGKERGAGYTNLNPGNYTFRVKAKYENGDWGSRETTVKLTVRPAWWMTLWFKILMILLAIALISTYIHLRIQRLQKQREMLKVLVEERTWEIQNKNELLRSQAMTLQQQNNQLKDLNATKNKLFSIIAHDLRGPFNVILGFQSILVNDYKACTEAERILMVKKTHSTAQKVYALVDNLLSWARIQTNSIHYNPVQFDLRITIMQRLDLYADIAQAKGIDFQNQLPEGIIAFADIDLLETIVRNLINNAVKFTPGGGSIHLKAGERENVITISVIDSGIGMTPGQIETLFNPANSQTHNGTNGERGSGLGLLLCKEFVEKNKGTITIESKPKRGSTFSFTIPAYSAEQLQAESKRGEKIKSRVGI